MSFDEQLDKELDDFLLDQFGPEFFKPGLDRIEDTFKEFNSKISKLPTKIITVAGTNGKGEASHYLNDLLLSDGKRVALWTSPHVLSVTERFRFNGLEIEHDKLMELFKLTVSRNKSFSYYEFLFNCFCEHIVEEVYDFVILEVGLGGRLDTTNLLDADYTLLTSISRDHEEYLGSDLKGILKEKLGVTRVGAPHFSSLETSFLQAEQQKLLTKKGVNYSDLFIEGVLKESDDFSFRNQVLALSLFSFLRGDLLSRESLNQIRQNVCCSVTKGRMEYVTIGEFKFIFIGAHNVDGIRKTINSLLAKDIRSEGLICAFSKRPIRDIKIGLSSFVKAPCLWKSIYVTEFNHPKAFSLDDLDETFNLRMEKDWKKLLDEILNDKKGQWIVTGSYYFIGEVQKYLISRFPDLEL